MLNTQYFAMIPEEVLTDPRLTAREIRIYGFLALVRTGVRLNVGQRRIAGQVHMDRRSVRAGLERLTEVGWIELQPPESGRQRARYRLLSPLFCAADKPEKTQDVITPETPKRVISAPPLQCAKCHKPRQRLPITGICRSCTNAAKLIQTIDQRLDERLQSA